MPHAQMIRNYFLAAAAGAAAYYATTGHEVSFGLSHLLLGSSLLLALHALDALSSTFGRRPTPRIPPYPIDVS